MTVRERSSSSAEDPPFLGETHIRKLFAAACSREMVFLMRANGEATSSGFVLASTKGLTPIGQLLRFRYS